jgi:hypothetical protein
MYTRQLSHEDAPLMEAETPVAYAPKAPTTTMVSDAAAVLQRLTPDSIEELCMFSPSKCVDDKWVN